MDAWTPETTESKAAMVDAGMPRNLCNAMTRVARLRRVATAARERADYQADLDALFGYLYGCTCAKGCDSCSVDGCECHYHADDGMLADLAEAAVDTAMDAYLVDLIAWERLASDERVAILTREARGKLSPIPYHDSPADEPMARLLRRIMPETTAPETALETKAEAPEPTCDPSYLYTPHLCGTEGYRAIGETWAQYGARRTGCATCAWENGGLRSAGPVQVTMTPGAACIPGSRLADHGRYARGNVPATGGARFSTIPR